MAGIIHVTERSSFRKCRRNWALRSLLCLRPQQLPVTTSYWVGSGIHAGLEGYYKSLCKKKVKPGNALKAWRAWFEEHIDGKELWNEEQQIVDEATALVEGILRHYIQWAPEQDKGLTFLANEVEVERKLPSGVILCGTLDLVAKDAKGRLMVIDHKSSVQKPDLGWLELDDQMTAYLWLAEEGFSTKTPPSDGLHNILKKSLPTIPPLLKDGTISRAKSWDTTAEVYRQAVLDAKLNPKDYLAEIQHFTEKGNQFFFRVHIHRSKAEIESLIAYAEAEAVDMLRLRQRCEESYKNNPAIFVEKRDAEYYPNPDLFCSKMCSFREVCKTMNEGGDANALVEKFFAQDDKFKRGL